jgi:hypothetical protein
MRWYVQWSDWQNQSAKNLNWPSLERQPLWHSIDGRMNVFILYDGDLMTSIITLNAHALSQLCHFKQSTPMSLSWICVNHVFVTILFEILKMGTKLNVHQKGFTLHKHYAAFVTILERIFVKKLNVKVFM